MNSRRGLLRVGGAVGLAACGLGLAEGAQAGSARPWGIVNLPPDACEGLGLIGRAYLRDFPDQRPVAAQLARALASDPGDTAARLRLAIDEAWSRGDSVFVEGWVLAEPEGLFCAAVALATPTFADGAV